ncbi:sigma-70 family RNA polymerase sigma factor [Microvirga massiliensis]|uniref:sigma-70 family RNA polymerase sigma factor n=1 Tax=Microvirga massiliensis TaxID=1033741 RepID=UPI00062B5ADF|nr:sigma-70 family RNA polymerase sigma factor [Microvirga massiliensis]
MMPVTQDDAIASFDSLRPRLIRIAYRMLGSVADAEDIVQDAFIRWHQTDRTVVRNPQAFLTRTVTRLCLDFLDSARVRRESYVGPWLPEPVVEPAFDKMEDITLPLMMALERLSPLERAAFLLHDVFGTGFDEIAQILGRDSAACRQLASRARAHIRAARPRFAVPKEKGMAIATAFYAASRSGDVQALKSLLSADVVSYTDGGGKAPAALKPIQGQDKVARFFAGIARKSGSGASRLLYQGLLNGEPGFVTIEKFGILQTTTLSIEHDRIAAIYIVRNPDKLDHIRYRREVTQALNA